jgi:ABC-2 type transport system permease protein
LALPLGYDRYAQRVIYDNKEFLMNAVSYLLDDQATISVRSRAISLRPLDAEKIRSQKLGWQALAVGAPLVLVACVGMALTAVRRRRFGQIQKTNH